MPSDANKPVPVADSPNKAPLPKDVADSKPDATAGKQAGSGAVKPEPGAGPPHQEFGGERS